MKVEQTAYFGRIRMVPRGRAWCQGDGVVDTLILEATETVLAIIDIKLVSTLLPGIGRLAFFYHYPIISMQAGLRRANV